MLKGRSCSVLDIAENIPSRKGKEKGAAKPERMSSVFKSSENKGAEKQTGHCSRALISPRRKYRVIQFSFMLLEPPHLNPMVTLVT